MNKKTLLILVAALVLFGTAQTSQAALTAVDPGPYNAKYGYFPIWYADSTAAGIPPAVAPSPGVLELCISQTASVNGPMCTLLPPPSGPGFDPSLPVVFPNNFPDEVFWFAADATIVGAGIDLTYVAALEGAFGGGPVLNGDQVSFARIRIRVDVPTPGSYTVTHPYGQKTYVVPVPPPGTPFDGRRAINDTVDIGLGAPGNFTGALGGAIGPFLRRAAGLITIGTETFIGDPNVLETVTGGPNGNIVRIQGPGIDLQTNQFALMGKLFNGALPTALSVDRSTYSRNAAGSHLDVFATSTSTATVSFQDDLTALSSTPLRGNGTGKFYGQEVNPAAVPANVIVTATDPTAAVPTSPTPLASPLVDVVKITRAVYALDSRNLVVEANSSDQVAIPTLTALGFGPLSPVDPAPTQQVVVNLLTLDQEPPARITVKSSAGGSDTEPVVIVPSFNLAPVAVNDSATATQNVAVAIAVLNNDTDPDGNLPLTVQNLTQPIGATATLNANQTVTFNSTSTGVFTFTYQAADSLGSLSNVATVTVTVSPPNRNPVANPDTANTPEDTPVTIPVLANDTDPDGNPLTVTAVSNFVNGTAVISGASVVFTPSLNFNGNAGFNYTVSDGQGGTATGTVTVTVTPVNDPPVANADTATTAEDTPVSIPLATLLVNDTDVDGNTLTVTAVGNPVSGTVLINGANAVFTPALNFNGTARFSYTISDGNGGTATATVSVTVTPVNDAPVANPDAATAASGIAVVIPVLANDTDVDGPVLTVGTATQGSNGSVVNNGANVTYTPNAGFTGQDTFTYRASDGSLLSNVATVTVTVNAVVVDLDIQQFQTTNNVRVGRGESVAITLRVRNQSAVNGGAPARVVGTLNGSVIYDQSMTVSDPPGGGTTSFNFPTFTPNGLQVGTINWVATISDTNPDVDQAAATSRIRP